MFDTSQVNFTENNFSMDSQGKATKIPSSINENE